MRTILYACLLLLTVCCLPAHAVQIAGIEVPEQVQVEGVAQPLKLNGAGFRKKFFFKIYLAALYLPQPDDDVAALLRDPPANRVMMHVVYDEIESDKLARAWRDGFEANLEPAQLQRLEARLQQFIDLFDSLRENDVVWLDHIPGLGTRVTVNGAQLGLVAGQEFNRALLSVWLGGSPVTESLKKALLGADTIR